MDAAKETDEVCAIGVAHAFGDDLHDFIGVKKTIACLGETSDEDPLANGFAGGSLHGTRHVGGRLVQVLGNLPEGKRTEAVSFDETKRVTDERRLQSSAGTNRVRARDLRQEYRQEALHHRRFVKGGLPLSLVCEKLAMSFKT